MTAAWQVLVIVLAGMAAIGIYIATVGGENVRNADLDLDHDRDRRARDE